MSSSSESSNKTYIGHVKSKNGGIKIIPGEKDVKILKKRDKILNHLEAVLSGGKSLKEKNISKYFKALGGKYIRNDMCIGKDSNDCRSGQKVSIGGAHKLLKLSKKKDLEMNNVLDTFKESAPVLYKKFESRIEGGKYSNFESRPENNNSRPDSRIDGGRYSNDYDYEPRYNGRPYYNDMRGGSGTEVAELSKLRVELEKNDDDNQLNQLINEINLIRFS